VALEEFQTLPLPTTLQVSILLLLDVALEGRCLAMVASFWALFQSFFYWMWLLRQNREGNVQCFYCVSILLLLDVALEV